MTRWCASVSVAALLATAVVLAQGKTKLSLGQAGANVPVSFLTAINSGKGLGTTGDKGDFDVDPLMVSAQGKLVVIREDCPGKGSQILLAGETLANEVLGQKDGCKRRRLGAFMLGDPVMHAKFNPGPNNLLLIGTVAGIVGGTAIATGGGDSSSPAAPSAPGAPATTPSTPTTPTTPTTPNVGVICGTFTATITPASVGCGFSSTWNGPFVLTCSPDGSATLRFERTNVPDQAFTYQGRVTASGAMEFSGSGMWNGTSAFNGVLTGQISADGRSITATHNVTFTSANCQSSPRLVQNVNAVK